MNEKNKLLKAVLKRSVSQVQNCIVDGEDPYLKDEHGRTFLHLSVFLRSQELVEYFLSEGLDVNECDQDKVTALHRACKAGCEGIVDILIAHGADVNAEANDSITPLHVAAAFGHSSCIQVLCSKGKLLKINCREIRNHIPLHFSADIGHTWATTSLIKHGCDVNAENDSGNRPLHFAAASGNPELCQVLIKASADIDAQNFNGQTALHLATQEAYVQTVLQLLSAQADPNLRDSKGNTCSHLAIKSGQIELVKIFMMDSRTDPSLSDNEENTVLHVALKLGHFNLIPMMIPLARDLTKQDAHGSSVIIEAIKNQLEDLSLEMLKVCPRLCHTATNELVTPLHLAAERGMRHLTRDLLIAGAQVGAVDSSGLTPSLYCAKNDSVLECLAMIEDIMMEPDNSMNENNQQQHQHVKGNSSKLSSRISS